MDREKLKNMSQNELSLIYIKKEELLNGYLSDIESRNFLKGSMEYNKLVNVKNIIERDMFQIDKEFQSRNK